MHICTRGTELSCQNEGILAENFHVSGLSHLAQLRTGCFKKMSLGTRFKAINCVSEPGPRSLKWNIHILVTNVVYKV
jgi:hypothetical protein